MTKNHKQVSERELHFIQSLTSAPVGAYYSWMLIAFISLSWGDHAIGETARSIMGKPPLDDASWSATGVAGAAISSRMAVLMIAFLGLSIYGLLLAYALSANSGLSLPAKKRLQYSSYALILVTMVYFVWSLAHAIASV